MKSESAVQKSESAVQASSKKPLRRCLRKLGIER
jgi:hypothetical protein